MDAEREHVGGAGAPHVVEADAAEAPASAQTNAGGTYIDPNKLTVAAFHDSG